MLIGFRYKACWRREITSHYAFISLTTVIMKQKRMRKRFVVSLVRR
jgi:hypothetical protein